MSLLIVSWQNCRCPLCPSPDVQAGADCCGAWWPGLLSPLPEPAGSGWWDCPAAARPRLPQGRWLGAVGLSPLQGPPGQAPAGLVTPLPSALLASRPVRPLPARTCPHPQSSVCSTLGHLASAAPAPWFCRWSWPSASLQSLGLCGGRREPLPHWSFRALPPPSALAVSLLPPFSPFHSPSGFCSGLSRARGHGGKLAPALPASPPPGGGSALGRCRTRSGGRTGKQLWELGQRLCGVASRRAD